MNILDHLIYLHAMGKEKPLNTTLQAVWLYATSGPTQTLNPDHGPWMPFYKEHNTLLEEAFALGTESYLQLPHADGKLFVNVMEHKISFVKKRSGHFGPVRKIMRALLPDDFQLMPVPGDGSEKKDTESSG